MTDTPSNSDAVLDTKGLYCPEPIMLMHNKVRDMKSGQILHVLATDPATQRDIPQFCGFLGHELIAQKQDEESYEYWLKIGE